MKFKVEVYSSTIVEGESERVSAIVVQVSAEVEVVYILPIKASRIGKIYRSN